MRCGSAALPNKSLATGADESFLWHVLFEDQYFCRTPAMTPGADAVIAWRPAMNWKHTSRSHMSVFALSLNTRVRLRQKWTPCVKLLLLLRC
mmetsp:Transcript_7812/g.22250  ORF Transcript_7812/g.22250 Transcript_7812/m.22250 type:complete len:92 (-) Transcript_7812:502-777(-)